MAARHKSVETKWYEKRDTLMTAIRGLERRDFFKVRRSQVAGDGGLHHVAADGKTDGARQALRRRF